ncbi:PHB depolymerase family esterase [Variovorax sp. J2P1-59]|uniref:extracellular catalytic domain type 1 short-chain-length polyhydroxyalkanoate depolymerase n=1 Tax=Variovorax flavidus TaxID=3053501 RepID=UPI002578B1E7|nr:PHB depolymerase family esterase [Variovorax sp. J2P1-59]MDM0078633.1 PHB depolymerase family esterase [Variovorax sp. J2P1-59]
MRKISPFPNPIASWFDMASEISASFLAVAPSMTPDSPPMTESHESHCLFVADSAPRRRAPMVVMLHGAWQDPVDFAAGTAMNAAAERHGFVVLYPAQSARHNAQQCWNWFDAAHQSRTRGEPARLTSLTSEVARDLHVDPDRIYVAGLSAGGAMAALLGDLFPDIYSAVGVHSGLAALAGTDLSSGLAAMRGSERAETAPTGMPTIVFHGDMDIIVNPINGRQVMEASFGSNSIKETRQHVGYEGRGFTRREYVGADEIVYGEHWILHEGGHAWSGGRKAGSYADPLGPDASEQMLRFFKQRRRPATALHGGVMLSEISPYFQGAAPTIS